jgi:hypothetical protein
MKRRTAQADQLVVHDATEQAAIAGAEAAHAQRPALTLACGKGPPVFLGPFLGLIAVGGVREVIEQLDLSQCDSTAEPERF